MPRLNFDPSRHGFHFSNNFVNEIVIPPLGVVSRIGGLCGGMSLAALAYFRNNIPIPTHRADDFGPAAGGVPPEGRLRSYIYNMQAASVVPFGLPFFLPDLGGNPALTGYRMSVPEFPKVKAAIDRGQFVLLGLRSSAHGNLGGHQVLAYGYHPTEPCIYVYDCNFPNQEIIVGLDHSNSCIVHKQADGSPSRDIARYGSFFVQMERYPTRGEDVPPYADLVAEGGVRLSAPVGDGVRQRGERLEVSAVVRNVGDYPAHVGHLLIWARDPRNRNRDADLGVVDRTTVLAPGARVTLRRTIANFGEEAGDYKFGACYLSEQNHWIQLRNETQQSEAVATATIVPGADAGRVSSAGGYTGPGTYFIRAAHSGKVLDVDYWLGNGNDDGRPLKQRDRHGDDNQKFIVEALASGFVRMRAKHSGKSLQVEGASTNPGARVRQMRTGDSVASQHFRIEPRGDAYWIRARHSGMVFDIAGGSPNNDAPLTQFTQHEGANQLFRFERTS